MRVVWSETAISHLNGIHRYITEDKPGAAQRMARRILACARQLGRYPHLGRPGREADTRELIVGGTPYIVVYEVRRERLVILAVLHAAKERTE